MIDKYQLRAEAISRLKNSDPETCSDFLHILFPGVKTMSPGEIRAMLIELLADDEVNPYYAMLLSSSSSIDCR